MDLRAKGSRLRLGRVSEPGRLYHITTVTYGRHPVFKDLTACRTLIKVLREQAEVRLVPTYAFVIMPDHLHWLMQLNHEPLSRVVARVKSLSALWIEDLRWQRGFHDHALRREEDVRKVARYLVANPLRAGLVTSIGDYPHWDAAWL